MRPPDTERQRARDTFDLEAAMLALPPWQFIRREGDSRAKGSRGSAGHRLRPGLTTRASDGLLREIARDTLAAVRCSQNYIGALRIVLGNQAHAEQFGYLLEMNTRTEFASEWTMRTILSQMDAASITFRKQVVLGQGRVQVMHCYRRPPARHEPAEALNAQCRRTEGEDRSGSLPPNIVEADIPH